MHEGVEQGEVGQEPQLLLGQRGYAQARVYLTRACDKRRMRLSRALLIRAYQKSGVRLSCVYACAF